MSKDTTFLNPHAGKTGRDGGPYLDQVEREAAEKNRARVEGREPDFQNATFSVGTPATPDYVMANRPDVASHPSMLAEAHAGSTNDGAEVLPVDDRVKAPDSPEGLDEAGSPVGDYAGQGELPSNEDASVNSPLVPADYNDPSANSEEQIGLAHDPSNPAAQTAEDLVQTKDVANGDVPAETTSTKVAPKKATDKSNG